MGLVAGCEWQYHVPSSWSEGMMLERNLGAAMLLAGAVTLAGCDVAELGGEVARDARADPGTETALPSDVSEGGQDLVVEAFDGGPEPVPETLEEVPGSDTADIADAGETGIDAPIEATDEGADLPADLDADVPPPLAAVCPPSGAAVPSGGLIPEPWRFHDLGTAMNIAGLFAQGATPDEVEEVQAIASRAGVAVREDAAWGVRFLEPASWADLVATCGFPADLPAGSYFLRTGTDGAFVAAPDEEGRLHALKTLKQLVVAAKAQVRVAAVLDRPASPIRGVGESYYGDPWAPAARLAMIPVLADLKFNFYMYAPKFDMSIATFWAYPFTDETLAHLEEVAAAARRNRIHACIQIHPQGVRFSLAEDFDAVMAKFHAAAAIGFDCFALAFDDSPKELLDYDLGMFASFVEGQVDWSNRVGAALHQAYPDAFLGFVPNDYWSGAEGVKTDLAYVGNRLDPLWSIAWTGPEVGSRSIAAADADGIAQILKRMPLLADNHPVVDNTQVSGVMNLAPLELRAPDLTEHVQGIVYNPMPVAHASLPGIATGADFAWNSAAYEPSRSLAAAATWLVGREAAMAVETLCRANYSPYSNSSPAPALEAALPAFWTEYEARTPGTAGEGLEAARLRALFATYAAIPAGLAKANGDFPAFLADVKPWSDKLGIEGDAGILALDLLEAKAAGQATDSARLADLKARRAALDTTVPKPAGTLMPAFLTRAIAELEGSLAQPRAQAD